MRRDVRGPAPHDGEDRSDHEFSGSEMNDGSDAAHQRAAIQHMMRRLDGFARGLGLEEAATRRIVEQVATDMPTRSDEERLVEARSRMILATV